MSLTVTQAVDEIGALFKAAWDAGAPGVIVLWDDTRGDPPATPVGGDPPTWARFSIKHNPVAGGQSAFGDDKRLYTRFGQVFVEIYTPYGQGRNLADSLAQVAMRAFEAQHTLGGVWFQNVRPVEVGKDGVWRHTNVVADFQYDEIR